MTAQQETSAALSRGRIRAMWASVAEQWEAHADEGDARVTPVTDRLLARALAHPGERVLELACGAGGLGIEVAARLGPASEVVVSDVVEGMVSIAARRAQARGLDNVRTAVLDLEAIAEPDGGYDVVLCREGLMFAVDPAGAAREMLRVTRPGGRVGASVWGPPERNPWLSLAVDVVGEQLGRAVLPGGGRGPFALGDPRRLRAIFGDAGFTDLLVEEVPCPLRVPSFDAWWTRTSTIGGPLVAVIAALGTEERDALVHRLRAAVKPYRTPGGVELPGVVLLLSARRPAAGADDPGLTGREERARH